MASIGYADTVRYQVFVSSTYLDLLDERKAVILALLGSDAFPAGMELFPATDEDAWELIQRVIQDSDYYLLVIGGKYGSMDSTDNLSYTEKEYGFAMSIGKPIMAFIHGAPEELPAKKIELSEDKRQMLEAFIAKVKSAHHVNMWTSAEDLSGKVSVSFNKFIRSNAAIGWVKADRASSAETISELAKARIRISEFESALAEERETLRLDLPDLAGGADSVKIDIWVSGSVMKSDGTLGEQIGTWVSVTTTWEDIFTAFGPDLLVETEEKEIVANLSSWVRYTFVSVIHPAIRKKAVQAGQEIDSDKASVTSKIVDLTTNQQGVKQVNRFLLQFKALGLIQRSDTNRIGNVGSYWILTLLGERNAVQRRTSSVATGDSAPPF